MKNHTLLAFLICSAMVSGCGSLVSGGRTGSTPMVQTISTDDKVALLPVANFTDVPQAGLRVEALLEPALRKIGLRQLQLYPPSLNPETLFEPSERKAQLEAEKWARTQGVRYVVSAAVNEWRYKVGVDGEPAVRLMVQVKDLTSGAVVYSSAGGRTGGSREALIAVGLQLTSELVSGIRIDAQKRP